MYCSRSGIYLSIKMIKHSFFSFFFLHARARRNNMGTRFFDEKKKKSTFDFSFSTVYFFFFSLPRPTKSLAFVSRVSIFLSLAPCPVVASLFAQTKTRCVTRDEHTDIMSFTETFFFFSLRFLSPPSVQKVVIPYTYVRYIPYNKWRFWTVYFLFFFFVTKKFLLLIWDVLDGK